MKKVFTNVVSEFLQTSDMFGQNEIVLLTSYGLVTGTPYKSFSKTAYKEGHVIESLLYSSSKKLSSDTMKEYIFLKNVKILDGGIVKFRFDELIIFTDDIIGITVGNFDL